MATQEFMAMGASNGAPHCFLHDLPAGAAQWSYYDAVDLPGADEHEKYLNACYLYWNIKSLTSFAIEGYIAGLRIRTPELTQLMYKPSTDTEALLEDIEPFARVCSGHPLSGRFVFQFTEILESSILNHPDEDSNPGIFAFRIGYDYVGDLKFIYIIEARIVANLAMARSGTPFSDDGTPYDDDGTPLATFDFQVGPKAGDTVTLEVHRHITFYDFLPYTCVLDVAEVTPEFWSY